MSQGRSGVAALAAGTVLFGVLGIGVLAGGSQDDAAAASGVGGGISNLVPPAFAPWVLKAGAICAEFPPALIAAQIEAESNWNVRAVSPVGAQGPAQFMPGTWAGIGRDDDGNGVASPFDIGDALLAQGRYDCQLADGVRGLGGDVVSQALAAYNAGLGAVLKYSGIPPYPETQAYVARILAGAAKYAAPPTGGAPTGTAAAVIAAAQSQSGVPYSWGGGGPTGPSRGFAQGAGTVGFDCSSLMQYAFAQGAGLNLPRVANDQARVGTAIDRSQIQPGDVIAFAHGNGSYFHIGLYIGNGQMIHAPHTGDVVHVSTVFGDSYYEALTWAIRRYV